MKINVGELVKDSSVRFGTSGVRGLVSEMTDEVCYAYVKAFIDTLEAKPESIVLGHDLRPSSPSIATVCAQACYDSGVDVIYAGRLPTPALAYAGLMKNMPVVIVTGSHIPYDRNGIKFYKIGGEISKQDEQDIVCSDVVVPEVIKLDGLPAVNDFAKELFLSRYVDFFGVGSLYGATVAIYEHSSVARDLLKEVLTSLGASVISLGRTEGFIPIDTEAVREEDIALASKWSAEYGFDALISTDGDGDRPMISDENGVWLRGDVVGVLTAKYLRADAVVTPVSSNTSLEICGFFSKVERTRIGSPYVITGMNKQKEAGLVVGYEANGGFLLGGDALLPGKELKALPTRDSFLPVLAVLASARAAGKRVSELVLSLPVRFTASGRLPDFSVVSSAALFDELAVDESIVRLMAFKSSKITTINKKDGVRVTFDDGDIVHLRASGNAPELRCYAESGSYERAEQAYKNCLNKVYLQYAALENQ